MCSEKPKVAPNVVGPACCPAGPCLAGKLPERPQLSSASGKVPKVPSRKEVGSLCHLAWNASLHSFGNLNILFIVVVHLNYSRGTAPAYFSYRSTKLSHDFN